MGQKLLDPTYAKPLIFSIGIHVVLVVAMLFSWTSVPETKPIKIPRHINAMVVDASELPSEKRKIAEQKKKAEAKKKQVKAAKEKELKRKAEQKRKKALQEKKRKEEIRKKKIEKENALKLKRKKEKERQKALEKKREQERQAKEKLRKEKAEKERRAREAKARREQQEKQLFEAMEKAEAERLAREAAEEEAREQEKLRQQALSAQRKADVSEVERFTFLIKSKVEQKWHIPPSVESGMKVSVRLNLTPTGELINAEIVRKSGNLAYDNSVISAIHAVGKFPVPTDRRLFEEHFRRITFIFNPKN